MMVKVYGPMMSLDASGTLGNAVTFSKWKGRNYVRERVIPANPKSGPQVGRRVMFGWLSEQWDGLSDANKATWQDLADQLVALPFNAYLGHNMERWHNFKPPTMAYPATETGTPATSDLDSAGWEENRIKILKINVAVADGWGYIICASDSTPVTPAVHLLKLVVIDDSVNPVTCYWTPPTRTTWYFRGHGFTDDGVLGAVGSEQTAIPP